VNILERGPAAVAAFLAGNAKRPKREPAEVARRLWHKPRRLPTKMRDGDRSGRSASEAGIDERV
jgi:hypothetical protein